MFSKMSKWLIIKKSFGRNDTKNIKKIYDTLLYIDTKFDFLCSSKYSHFCNFTKLLLNKKFSWLYFLDEKEIYHKYYFIKVEQSHQKCRWELTLSLLHFRLSQRCHQSFFYTLTFGQFQFRGFSSAKKLISNF